MSLLGLNFEMELEITFLHKHMFDAFGGLGVAGRVVVVVVALPFFKPFL